MEISSVYNKKKPFMLNIRVNVYVKVGEHEFFSSGEHEFFAVGKNKKVL